MTATLIIDGEAQSLPLGDAERIEYSLVSQGYSSIRQQSSTRVIIEVYK